ncbi:MAG TPA: DUF3379 family protein [Xanthomonadales bacterium]|nr:DUF3379 family protein [Xanthomonadales bacterium]
MSMKFSEFRQLLNSDPGSQDPEYQAARRSGPEFIRAAAASDVFEQQLARASRLPVDPGFTASLKASANSPAPLESSLGYRFRYALAATVLLAISAILLMPQLQQPQEPVEAYVAHHFDVDGYALLEQTGIPQTEELAAMLAAFDLQMSPELAAQVQFVKYCPTPEGMGVHLVMNSPQGLVTVIFMPGMVVQEGEQFAFAEMAAELVNLTGLGVSAAIVGRTEQMKPGLGQALRQGVARLSSGV